MAQEQQKDSLTDHSYRFKYTQLIIPTVLIGTGIIGCKSDWFQFQNHEISDELQENIDDKFTIEDFAQYAPSLAVYGLNLCGVKGKHDFRERTIILATSFLIMTTCVTSIKSISHVQRPDKSSYNSFPSGHTATAFMGATFLWNEYHDVSPWIGVAGYAVAAGTGFFRMYNNRHWLTDVLAGAGIGILSTDAAYWLYPVIQKTIYKKKHKQALMAMPYYNGQNVGASMVLSF